MMNANITFSLLHLFNSAFHSHLDVFFRASGFFYVGYFIVAISLIMVCRTWWSVNGWSEKSFRNIASGFFLLAFILFLWITKKNIPVFDEFTGLFEFLGKIQTATNWREKIQLLNEPYFECKVPVDYLIAWMVFKITGPVYLLHTLLALNACTLFLIARILLRHAGLHEKRAMYFPFLFLFIFQAEFMQSSLNAFSGLCYNGTLLFSLLAFLQADKNKFSNAILTMVFATLAIFSFGNGMCVIPVLIIQLLFKTENKNRVWMMAGLVILSLAYFINYHPNNLRADKFDWLSFLLFTPVFLGSALQFFYVYPLPLLAGVIMLWILFRSLRNKTYKQLPAPFYLLLFISGTALLGAWYRHGSGSDAPLRLRYGVFSAFAILCSICLLLKLWPEHINLKFIRYVAILAIAYNLLSGFFFYPESVLTILNNKIMLQHWKNHIPLERHSPYYPPDLEPVIQLAVDQKVLDTRLFQEH